MKICRRPTDSCVPYRSDKAPKPKLIKMGRSERLEWLSSWLSNDTKHSFMGPVRLVFLFKEVKFFQKKTDIFCWSEGVYKHVIV